jgi:hypothetical protein
LTHGSTAIVEARVVPKINRSQAWQNTLLPQGSGLRVRLMTGAPSICRKTEQASGCISPSLSKR